MSEMQKIPWKRIAVEAAAIVASILLAFAIDAWWQDRGARAQEAAAIVGLIQDFEAYLDDLNSHEEFYQRRLAASRNLLEAIGPSTQSTEIDVFSAIGIVGNVNELRFPSSTLDMVLSDGGFTLFQSPELRIQLAKWIRTVERVDELNEFLYREVHLYGDYMRTRYPIRDLASSAGADDLGPSSFDIDISTILNDLEFENAITQQWYATWLIVEYINEVRESVENILLTLKKQ